MKKVVHADCGIRSSNTPNPLRFPLYAPERVCKIVPQAGDEIDAIIWLQGRIID